MHPSFATSEAREAFATGGLRADDHVAAFAVTHLDLSDLHRDAERTEAGCMPFPPPGVTLR